MQRILSPGEIEDLDHTAIPRVRVPERGSVFADRAARLRKLAKDSPVADYLLLMAALCEAQQAELKDFEALGPDETALDLAQAHGMPPLQAAGWTRDPQWTGLLRRLLQRVEWTKGVPPEAVDVCKALRKQIDDEPAGLEALADTLLGASDDDIDGAAAPFVMGALQVYWTDLAIRLGEKKLPVTTPFGVCPACGSLPVASLVRVGGAFEGYRYLCCELCSTQWHMVRVKCSHCEDNESIAYHALDGGSQAIKAESCDHCHTYRKIFYQDKDMEVEPVADDLASLTLDVLMGEAGYSRASGNPLLWQGDDDE